jgi:diacylglycerol kinase (ATP)
MQRPPRAIVIHSPHSGRSSELSQALTQLQTSGIEVAQAIPISQLDTLPPQGANWQEHGMTLAIAAGGDGVVGGVITHIAESDLPLGILPLGTANDIARSLRIPQDLQQAIAMIVQGREQAVDIGVAQPAEQAPHLASPTPRAPVLAHVPVQQRGFFAHALAVGLNVQFARIATNVATRQRFGRLTYPLAAIETLRNHEALDVELHFEELFIPQAQRFMLPPSPAQADQSTILRCHVLQVTVINAPIFGGQWQLAIPGASLSDRLLDIVVIEEVEVGVLFARLAHLFGTGPQPPAPPSNEQEYPSSLRAAELTGIPGIHHVQAQAVTITTNADPRDVTLDGEVRGQTPIHARMADKQLRVAVPQS